MDPPLLTTDRLTIRSSVVEDAEELVAYYKRNIEHLRIWEPERDAGFYEVGRHRALIARSAGELKYDLGVRFVVFERGGSELIATINLVNIRREIIHCGLVGYSVDESRAGRGYATEMLEAVVAFAFDTLNLHRIEASYQPSNHASARVLEKAGFAVEGYARDHLFLNGAWRDGVLVAKRNGAWRVP